MPNALAIAREYFPDASDGELDYIIWERTGFPCFWEGEPEASLRKQLGEYKEMAERYPYGTLCFNCNALTVNGEWICIVCQVELTQTPLLTA